ncbi:MAG: protein translocase subunit SecF [Holosporales bacterium]|jgi:preprotein translocase subunit SecF|nr:protein translocase subunit SecF [Holosporales bacterium]
MIKIIPDNVNINFIGQKNKVFILSFIVILVSMLSVLVTGLNYGIDFKGGYVVEARFPVEQSLENLRQKFAASSFGDFSLQQLGKDGRDIVMKLQSTDTDTDAIADQPEDQAGQTDSTEGNSRSENKVIEQVKAVLGEGVVYRRIETIGPTVGAELIHNAIIAVVLSILAIAIYIAIRFEWQFAVCGMIALAQDCIGVVGAYSLLKMEFNASAIVAILTTASYSVNDSIVIFDRIRENIKRHRKMPMPELINRSINETLSRTVLTAGSTLLAVLALCLFGGEVISAFSTPIFIGISLGTFSSIALSAPLLLLFNLDRDKIAGTPKVVAGTAT